MTTHHKTQNWSFTLNNFTPEEVTKLNDSTEHPNLLYLIYGKEHTINAESENLTPHIQGYVQFKHQKTMSAVKKHFGSKRYHLEPSKGNAQQNITYCSKEDTTPYIYGTPKMGYGKGKRNDLTTIKDLIKDYTIQELIEDNTLKSIQQIKFAETCINYQQQPRTEYPFVTWICGDSGVGKSQQVYLDHNKDDIHKQTGNIKWFDGYNNQPVVILDDIRADFAKFNELLTLLDKYPHRVEVKCGSRVFNSPTIYITSPYTPEEMYKNKTPENLIQLTRRIDKIIHFDYPHKYITTPKSDWYSTHKEREYITIDNSHNPNPNPIPKPDIKCKFENLITARPKKNVKRKVMINNVMEDVTEINESE